MHFQWYPGHMTKARRMMQENIKLIDLIIELVDARVPLSSRNPDIDELGKNKARLDFYREQLSQLGLGLEDKMDVKVGVLSGGQRQAMALLMSTMTPIEFLILDEHTAALDPKTAELIMQLTDKIVKEKQLTTIMVTHNLRYAVEYGNRLVMMHNGHMILDKKGKEKEDMAIDDILTLFNEISIECGN